MISYAEAIIAINPNATFSCIENEGIVEWVGGTTPISMEDITAKRAELQTEYDSQQYSRDRAEAYPSLTDQADMAYWDRKNGTTTLDDAITAVKSAYPKT
jgi:hypothetical protein